MTWALSVPWRCPKSGGDKSRAPTLCLVCGTLLCSQSYCCQTELEGEDVGACTAHTYSCGSGVGIFLRWGPLGAFSFASAVVYECWGTAQETTVLQRILRLLFSCVVLIRGTGEPPLVTAHIWLMLSLCCCFHGHPSHLHDNSVLISLCLILMWNCPWFSAQIQSELLPLFPYGLGSIHIAGWCMYCWPLNNTVWNCMQVHLHVRFFQ